MSLAQVAALSGVGMAPAERAAVRERMASSLERVRAAQAAERTPAALAAAARAQVAELRAALELYTDPEDADYRASVRESIDKLERRAAELEGPQ